MNTLAKLLIWGIVIAICFLVICAVYVNKSRVAKSQVISHGEIIPVDHIHINETITVGKIPDSHVGITDTFRVNLESGEADFIFKYGILIGVE